MKQTIVIFSATGDPHADWAASGLRRAGVDCHVVASDRLADVGSLTWELGVLSRVQSTDGQILDLSEVDTIWWRRSNNQKCLDPDCSDIHLINRCVSAAWNGALLSGRDIRVIDDPFMVFRAEVKPIQLEAALRVGFKVPATLVSNHPGDIREFASLNKSIVAKTLRHTPQTMLETVEVSASMLQDDESLRLCPTIYQAKVDGDDHLRLLVFGEEGVGAKLTSPHLDWRGRKDVEMVEYHLDSTLLKQCLTLLHGLGLSMAVFDFKVGPDGPVFLEINPQGQFLFLEILSDADWEDRFAKFLLKR